MAAVLCTNVGAGPAAAARCEPPPEAPAVTARIDPGQVVYDHSRDRAGIQALRRQNGRVGASPGQIPVGLTSANLAFRMETRVAVTRQSRKRYCADLAKLDASLGFDWIRVHVTRDYARGSCPYKAIVDHERRHVAVFQGTLKRYAETFRRTLRREADRLAPVALSAPGDRAAQILQDRLHNRLKPLLRRIEQSLEDANAALDSPKSYARDHARCRDW